MGSPIPWMAAAEGMTQLNNTAIQGYQQRRNLERQNQYNREMAEYQYSKDVEMWNMANEYNSPQAQMERLKSAGLNPNLVYGHGAVAGQTASQIPKYQAPSASFNVDPMVKMPSMLGMFQDFAMKQAQIDNLKKQNQYQDFQNVIKSIEASIAEKWGEQSGYESLFSKIYKNTILKNTGSISGSQADMALMQKDNFSRLLEAQTKGQELKNEGQEADNIFKTFENSFRSIGITSSDNIFVRMITRMMLGTKMGEWWKSISWK